MNKQIRDQYQETTSRLIKLLKLKITPEKPESFLCKRLEEIFDLHLDEDDFDDDPDFRKIIQDFIDCYDAKNNLGHRMSDD